MNAFRLRPLAQKITRQQFRGKATTADAKRRGTFKTDWLSDPSTYPIMVIMGCGLTMIPVMSLNALLTYRQGVDISPETRGSIMKNYSNDYRTGIVERWVNFRGGISAEGKGINTEEWSKQKEDYSKN